MSDQANDAGREIPLRLLARRVADLIPPLVGQLTVARPGRVYREILGLLERPLLTHVLAITGGNQLRAARLLGVNRNTLRKRCRQLGLPLPRASGRARREAPAPALSSSLPAGSPR